MWSQDHSRIEELGLTAKFKHISTGGGACLALLEGSKLPGVEAIQNISDVSPLEGKKEENKNQASPSN